jgi:hypothetical protein
MTKWYDRGRTGEYLLDQVESVLDGYITLEQFVARCKQVGLNDAEVAEIVETDELS